MKPDYTFYRIDTDPGNELGSIVSKSAVVVVLTEPFFMELIYGYAILNRDHGNHETKELLKELFKEIITKSQEMSKEITRDLYDLEGKEDTNI